MTAADETWLRHAYRQALKGEGHTRPNPPVGAVVVRDGRLLGAGHHARCGGDHAEVAALKACARAGHDVRGATLYVTLEPCSKAGRVGACTDAIVAGGVARVVYALQDPNPTNRGKARRILARHGIVCERARFADRQLQDDLIALLAPFTTFITTGRPFVTVKLAMTLDGRICDDGGDARWISSAASRRITDALRRQVDAIMVGAETIRRDNPTLLSHGRANCDLLRVVVSRSGKLPRSATVFTDGRNPTHVYRTPHEALTALAQMGCLHVLCEGGLKLAASLAEAGCVDRWINVMAPKVIGRLPIEKALTFKGGDTFVVYPN